MKLATLFFDTAVLPKPIFGTSLSSPFCDYKPVDPSGDFSDGSLQKLRSKIISLMKFWQIVVKFFRNTLQ